MFEKKYYRSSKKNVVTSTKNNLIEFQQTEKTAWITSNREIKIEYGLSAVDVGAFN